MKKNLAGQNVSFQMRDKTDPETAVTTGTPTILVDKDGVQASGAGSAPTHIGNGSWNYSPTQAETNGNHVQFTLLLSGAIPSSRIFDPIDVSEYKADVSNLDATVSSRMPTTHIDATAGKVDGVALTDACTTNTDMRGTDNASTHTAADAGTDAASKILATPANKLATSVAGEVTTDAASRTASQADLTNVRQYGQAEIKTHGTTGDTLPQTVTKAP